MLNKRKQLDLLRAKLGFTLVEIVISLAVFSILTLIIMGIYVAFSNNQWRAQKGQEVLNDAQYALEVMAREIRSDEIYYETDPACPQLLGVDYDNCLRLQRNDGTIIAFLNNDNSNTVDYAVYSGGSWSITEIINFHKILDLDFVWEPNTNPFVDGGPNQQPKVTIKLVVQPDTQRDFEKSTFRLQTTVSSRVYKR